MEIRRQQEALRKAESAISKAGDDNFLVDAKWCVCLVHFVFFWCSNFQKMGKNVVFCAFSLVFIGFLFRMNMLRDYMMSDQSSVCFVCCLCCCCC